MRSLSLLLLALVVTASAQAPVHRLTDDEAAHYKAAVSRYEAKRDARIALETQLKLALALEAAAKQDRDLMLKSYLEARRLDPAKVKWDAASLAWVERKTK